MEQIDRAAAPSFAAAEVARKGAEMRAALGRDGVLVVRGLLAREEIAGLRSIVAGHLARAGRRFSLGRTQPNAAVAVPALAPIFAHPKIVAALKQLLGEDQVAFTGHCDIHMNMLSGWHKDSGESVKGGYFKGDYMAAPDCRVVKAAIYLQDSGARDGFTARLGSHRMQGTDGGEAVKVATRAGDVVIFDVRLSHTGQLPDPVEKGLKAISLSLNGGSRDREDNRLVSAAKSLYWKAIGRRDRLSIFFTYGAPNAFTDDFAAANMDRQTRQGAGDDAGLPPQLRQRLEAQGVTLSAGL